ncbi:MAG: ABC transporter permease [Bacteroidales bacterium]|nr:ABC transporter permease [Bacteroidales bacterium]
MKNNTWTIIKKEFARFFGDRSLLFTTVIMPGLLIYLVYSLMGEGIGKMVTEGRDDVVTMRVENMPESMADVFAADSQIVVLKQAFGEEDVKRLDNKDLNEVLVRFPQGFDSLVAVYAPQSGEPAPNVEIYYNSNNNASDFVYKSTTAMLDEYEKQMSNKFDVNRVEEGSEAKFDMADEDSIGAMIWSKLLPMLIVMMLFSGTMAIAPSAIAGEKERGTIATLLVTPMRRNQLALGKIVSLGCIALLSGISSFIGIALSLPKMISGEDVDLGFNYTFNDYFAILLVIFATVLIMASAVSLLSALAKDVKSAGTMITPFMLIVMLAGLMPMFQNGTPESFTTYIIPFYNSIEVLTDIFAHKIAWTNVMICLASNVVYTGIAVWGLTKMFSSEKVMFGK